MRLYLIELMHFDKIVDDTKEVPCSNFDIKNFFVSYSQKLCSKIKNEVRLFILTLFEKYLKKSHFHIFSQ